MKKGEKLETLNYNVRVAAVAECAATISRSFLQDSEAQKDEFLTQTVTQAGKDGEGLTEAIKQTKVVSNLDEKDSARDAAVKVLFSVADGFFAMPVPSVKSKIAGVKEVLSKYSRTEIVRSAYTEESTLIKSLLQDLEAQKEDISSLTGLLESVDALKAAQSDFDSALDEYEAAQGAKKESASSLKKPLVTLINEKIVGYLSLQKMLGNTSLASFSTLVSAAVQRANSTGAKKSAKESDTKEKVENK